jgi:hypothetical protein
MKRERCTARRRDGQQCGAPAVPGATVCRRHGGSAPAVRRNAEQLVRLREFRASLPFLQQWTDQLKALHERDLAELAELAEVGRPRRCRARRRDGKRCRAWAIRGGYVCRMHGGAAPQVRAKARARLESARIVRELAARGT